MNEESQPTTTKLIAERLKAARLAAGYPSAKAFADAMGIPRATYFTHESGSRALKDDVRRRYADELGVTLGWLSGETHPTMLRGADSPRRVGATVTPLRPSQHRGSAGMTPRTKAPISNGDMNARSRKDFLHLAGQIASAFEKTPGAASLSPTEAADRASEIARKIVENANVYYPTTDLDG